MFYKHSLCYETCREKKRQKFKFNKIYDVMGRKKIKDVNEVFKISKYLCIMYKNY